MADVSALIDAAQGFAADSHSQAQELVESAVETISGLATPIQIVGPEFSVVEPPLDQNELPSFEPPAFEEPEKPEPVGELLTPDLAMDPAPENTLERPVFADIPRPNQLRNMNMSAPTINTSFAFPSPPAALDIHIDVPTTGTYTMPDRPELMLPAFSAMKPTDDVTAPADYVEKLSAAYREQAPGMYAALSGQMDAMLTKINPRFNEQMAAIETRLAKFMEGGSALTAAVEDAIYERTRSKVSAETRRVRDAAYADAARRGFVLPDGVLNSSVNQARVAGMDASARAAADIAIKQAELEQQNAQFAVTTSLTLRNAVMSAAISYHSNLISINGQALDYAKSVLSAAVQVYDTLVKAYSAKLEAYRAEAGVYEVQMRGVLARVQVYQSEIEALRAMVGVDESKVAVYKARVDALESQSRVYRSQIDAVLGKASLEKLKIELFGEQVRAYSAEAQAKSAEWQGYSAAIAGEEAKQRAYGEEVRAFATEIESYRAKVQAKSAQVQMQMAYNDGIVRQYVANVDSYRAMVDAKSKIATTKLDSDRLKLYAFQAKLSGQEAQARTTLSYYQTRAHVLNQDMQLVLQAATENARLATTQIKAVADTSIAGAQVYQGLASSALSGMNTLVTAEES